MNMFKSGEEKKRGRRKKGNREYEVNKGQTKFFVDLSNDKEGLALVMDILVKSNKKSYGRPINFKDISLFALGKLNVKDIERIQERSLSEMEKVERLLREHNQKNGSQMELGEFLVKKLNI